MSLTTAVSGIFPIVSFLHVPKQMPQPQWLVLGTGFLLDVPSLPTKKRKEDGLLSRIQSRSKKGQPLLLLTVAHNFAPWRVREWKLNIPDDWRKMRYILGNVYQYDQFGSCLKDSACPIQIEAMHPTLDLALLSIPDAGKFVSQVVAAASLSGEEDSDFNARMRTFRLEETLKKESEEILLDAIGFRGRGSLGDTRVDGEEATKKLSIDERQKMVEEHKHAVGRQDLHVFSFTPEFKKDLTTGIGFGRNGCPYIGMSGSAVLERTHKDNISSSSSSRVASGIFYGGEFVRAATGSNGKEEETLGGKLVPKPNTAWYVPARDILKWCEDIL